LFSSCKKYLDKKNNAAQVVPTTISDLQALLDNTADMSVKTPANGEGSSDDYFILQNTFNARGELERRLYLWQKPENRFSEDWSNSYLPIYLSNLSLEQIEKIPVTSQNKTEWNQVKGTALFFRSFYCQQLAWIYCKAYNPSTAASDKGIVWREQSDFNVPSRRISLQESYDRINSDTKLAATLLPEIALVATRPSKCAAYALLARNYLTMGEYDSSLKYSSLSLGLYNRLMDYNNAADVAISTNFPFKIFNKETIFLTQMSRLYNIVIPGSALVDTVLYASYHANDLRRQAFFRASGNYRRFKGNYTGSSTLFSGIATDEVWLIRAESHARKQNKDAALSDLNTLLRTRWTNTIPYVDVTATDSNEALQIILRERRKELLCRGLRWIDIKRLNRDGAGIIPQRYVNNQLYSLTPNEYRYALPLPEDIVAITGVAQNEGW
jgi:hypothetical protein